MTTSTTTKAQDAALQWVYYYWTEQMTNHWLSGTPVAALQQVVERSGVKASTLYALLKKGCFRMEKYDLPHNGKEAGTIFIIKNSYQPSYQGGTVYPVLG